MNTEYRRYIVKVGNKNVMECDDFEEAKNYAIAIAGLVFDNYEYAIIYRA